MFIDPHFSSAIFIIKEGQEGLVNITENKCALVAFRRVCFRRAWCSCRFYFRTHRETPYRPIFYWKVTISGQTLFVTSVRHIREASPVSTATSWLITGKAFCLLNSRRNRYTSWTMSSGALKIPNWRSGNKWRRDWRNLQCTNFSLRKCACKVLTMIC